MKKRIVSMILALSMMLSILPVSAFADAGAGLSSAAAEETNSITYSAQSDYEDVGTNAETQNQVVKIKFGDAGLPKAAAGTGWSYTDAGRMLTINGVANANTEYILDGTVGCTVFLNNVSGATVYLLDGTVEGTLRVAASSLTGVYVLGGSYADVQLFTGTIEGGTYDKLTENGGEIKGGFFRDISGLKPDTQQQAHKLILPENCTLNGRKETGDIYIVKPIDCTDSNLKLVVESDTSCEGWAVATTSDNGGVMTLPAGVTDYNFTRNGNVIAIVSISEDGRKLSASFSAIPGNAPMKLVTIQSMSKELRFTNEGVPDVTDVACVESLDEGEHKLRAYLCRNWTYACYPNMPNSRGVLMMADQGGREIDLKALSPAPINCAVQLTNATITDAAFGEKGALVLTSGKITGGIYPDAMVGVGTTGNTGKVEITGGVFDSLSCYGECTISDAVILDCNFSNFIDNGKFTVSNTVFGALPDDLEGALAAGQKLSKLTVRNGDVVAMNGRNLTLSTKTIYLVGKGSAELTLNTKVRSINEEAVENYNANTSAEGKVLRITGNNDGKDILVNKSTDVSDLMPLRITEEGLPDLTEVEPKEITGGGMKITLYEGLGWKYATMSGEDDDHVQRTMSQILITSPDGSPVDLTSDTINHHQVALKSDSITLQDVTVTSMYADAPVELHNAVIESGYFQKEVSLDETSTIAGGVFDATVKLRDNAKITAGVFHDIELPDHASNAAVIKNAVILGSLTGNNSKAAVSDTVSLNRIDSAYLAAGQQQSELRNMDGVMTDVNGNSVANVAAVYCIGKAGMVLTFTTPVTNINGKPVSAYTGASLSDNGKTLILSGRNDGKDIVVNQTGETTEKPKFTVTVYGETGEIVDSPKYAEGEEVSITAPKLDGYTFTEWYAGGVPAGTVTTNETITFKMPAKDVILQPLYEETTVPAQKFFVSVKGGKDAEYSVGEDVSIEAPPAKEGFTFTHWEANCELEGADLNQETITFKMPDHNVTLTPKYEMSQYTLTIKDENGKDGKVEQHFKGDLINVSAPFAEDGYTFTGWKVEGQLPDGTDTSSAKLSFRMPANDVTLTPQYAKKYSVTVNGLTQGNYFEGEDVTIEPPQYEGLTFAGWVHTDGLPKGTDTSGDTITFKMPANDVTVYANLIQTPPTPEPDPEPETFALKVTDAKVTLKDGGAVADLTAVPVGTELKVTAPEKDGYTFAGWEKEGLPADANIDGATITFKMPANKVTLKANYIENAPKTYELKVTNAQVTLQDGSEVADLNAVRVGTKLVVTADADTDTSVFKKWNCTGMELTKEQSTNRVLEFTMPDHDVDLMAEFEVPAPTPDPKPDPDPNPNPNRAY